MTLRSLKKSESVTLSSFIYLCLRVLTCKVLMLIYLGVVLRIKCIEICKVLRREPGTCLLLCRSIYLFCYINLYHSCIRILPHYCNSVISFSVSLSRMSLFSFHLKKNLATLASFYLKLRILSRSSQKKSTIFNEFLLEFINQSQN